MAYKYNPDLAIQAPNFNFYDAVSLRRMHQAKSFAKLGAKDNITTTETDLWSGTGNFVLLTAAETLSVVSSSANDTAAGTGLRTALIAGLDANGLQITEVVTMNGTTPVVTTQPFYRVNEFIALTVGSGGYNAGNVNVTGSSSTTQVAYMKAESNRALQAHYTIPAGKYGIVRWILSSASKNSAVEFEFYYQENGFARIPISNVVLLDSTEEINIPLGAFFLPMTTLSVRVKTLSGTGAATTNYVGYLIDESVYDSSNPA